MHSSSLPIRRGSTLTEFIVAATLLVGSIGILSQLTVRTSRLWQDVRHHQLAMDELSNQLERLIALDEPQRTAALSELTPSEPVQIALPNPRLNADTVRDRDGTRLVMSINWDRPGRSQPLLLVGWIDPMPDKAKGSEGVQP